MDIIIIIYLYYDILNLYFMLYYLMIVQKHYIFV